MSLQENRVNLVLAMAAVGLLCYLLPPEVLKPIVSQALGWPVAILIVALVFFTRFSGAVDLFLRNVASVKLPGGVEIQTQGSVPSVSAKVSETDGGPTLTRELREQLLTAIDNMTEKHQTMATEKAALQGQLQLERLQKLVWKFSYLNLFLVPNTKNVLYWMVQSQTVSRHKFHLAWQIPIPDPSQREIILNVLIQYGFLHEEPGILRSTPEGYAFLQFIGGIPYAPPPSESAAT